MQERHVRCVCHVINLVVNQMLQTPLMTESAETSEKPRHRRLSGERKTKKTKYILYLFEFFINFINQKKKEISRKILTRSEK